MSPGPEERAVREEDYQRLLRFRTELRAFLRWSEDAAHAAGLTPSLHQLLLVVRGHHADPHGPTIGQASEALHIRHHSAVELAQRAEAAQLVRRERDPHDHRIVYLQLTDQGRRQLELLTREHLTRIATLADVLAHVVEEA